MEIFFNPKTLFKKEGALKMAYYSVRSWFKYTFNKNHLRLIKEAYTGRPYDHRFLYDIEHAKIKEMSDYLEEADRFEGVEHVVRDMRICLSLIEIFSESRNLFHFNGHLTFEDADGGMKKIGNTDDFAYICDVNVNLKNIDRFVKNPRLKKYVMTHPHELYILKAKHLYHKIHLERDGEWWD